MLAESEKKVLKSILPEMATIVNLIPGDVFSCKDAETLLIMQRKLPESDLRYELTVFNEIFAKQKGASISDIANSFVAYVKIKVLLDENNDCFEGHSYRSLFKECKNQEVRINNIVRLTNTSALTADDYQKEKIELVLRKNSAFLAALTSLISSVEKRLERLPKEEVYIEGPETEIDEAAIVSKKRRNILDEIAEWVKDRATKKEKEAFLKSEEEKQSKTFCTEIPFYDKAIIFTDHKICRDIPEFCILKRKENVYFGKSRNVSANHYDNSDESLMELTKANEEFIQFMTEDILGDEYELKPFTDREKNGMQMYFDFMNRCFEKYIGVVLTVREYLDFKRYYNKLVLKMFELEQEQKEQFYKALVIAEKYLAYMRVYCLDCADSREEIIRNILSDDVINYLSDMDLILRNHIVGDMAKDELLKLCENMKFFHRKEEESTEITNVLEEVPGQANALASYVTVPTFQQMQPQFVQQNMIQIVVQILDEKREVLDEALYAGDNIRQALLDYERKDACIKRLGLRNNGVDVFYKEEVNQ